MPFDPFDFTDKPIERAKTLPSKIYFDPTILDLEYRHIYDKNWIFVTHKSRLIKNGGQLKTIIGTEPVIIIEDDAGVFRAFIDVCKHRGGPLCLRKGSRSVLQCQYHGWTYTSGGKLRGVPEFDRVELFDKNEFGLTEIEVKEFSGLIFVRLNHSDHSNAIELTMTEILEETKTIDFSAYDFHLRGSFPVACNWKVYIDNYLEGYHIPHVHPELNKLLDYRTYKTKVSPWHSLQYSNFKEGDSFYGSINDMAFYYFLYPNCMLNILPGRIQTNIVEPVSAESCMVHFDYYYDRTVYSEERIKQDLDYSEFVQREDEEICESVQKRLHSSYYDQGRYSVKCEQGVFHFHSLIRKSLKMYLKN